MSKATTNYAREQLIDALRAQHEFYCHDDPMLREEEPPEKYLIRLQSMSDSDLIEETSTDESFTLAEFMSMYG